MRGPPALVLCEGKGRRVALAAADGEPERSACEQIWSFLGRERVAAFLAGSATHTVLDAAGEDADGAPLAVTVELEKSRALLERVRPPEADAAESIRHLNSEPAAPPDGSLLPGPRKPLRVLGCAINGVADELALAMLVHVLDDLPIAVDVTAVRSSELVSLVQASYDGVLADLPEPIFQAALSRQRVAAMPNVRILVGRCSWRWRTRAPVLREAGANPWPRP